MCFSSVLWLMVIDLLSVSCLALATSVFVEENFLLSTSLSFMYFSISHFLIFHIFLVLCPLFLTCLHQVSAGPPILKGTLPMLYYIYGRYGGAERGRGEFVDSFISPSLPDRGPQWLAFTSFCLRFPFS